MDHLIVSFFRAIRSLFAPGMGGVLVKSVLITIATLMLFIVITSHIFGFLATLTKDPSLAAMLPWLGGIGSMFAAWMLFPGIMPVIISFYDERIASIIERYDYPAAPPVRVADFWKELFHDMRFSAMVISLNLLVLPLYLVPVVNIVTFPLLNGYLLGREFFVMVARRYMTIEEANALRLKHARAVLTAGIAVALLTVIPIVNLVAPFWGIAVMVHLYHRLERTPVLSQVG